MRVQHLTLITWSQEMNSSTVACALTFFAATAAYGQMPIGKQKLERTSFDVNSVIQKSEALTRRSSDMRFSYTTEADEREFNERLIKCTTAKIPETCMQGVERQRYTLVEERKRKVLAPRNDASPEQQMLWESKLPDWHPHSRVRSSRPVLCLPGQHQGASPLANCH